MTTVKINVTRILKEHLFEGKAGKYLDLVLMENKDGPDQYGNDGFVIQGVSKEARERGEKGPIIGNWKTVDRKKQAPAPRQQPLPTAPAGAPTPEDDDVPF